jgi:hypothetical protein
MSYKEKTSIDIPNFSNIFNIQFQEFDTQKINNSTTVGTVKHEIGNISGLFRFDSYNRGHWKFIEGNIYKNDWVIYINSSGESLSFKKADNQHDEYDIMVYKKNVGFYYDNMLIIRIRSFIKIYAGDVLYLSVDNEKLFTANNLISMNISLSYIQKDAPYIKLTKDLKLNASASWLDLQKTFDSVFDKYKLYIENNEESKDNNKCSVCINKEPTMIFVGCGHQCICEDCSTKLKICPLCRKESHTIKVFKS